MAEALGAVFPATTLQTCIVHLIRNSLDYASWKDRKALAAALRPIYTARQRRGRRGRAGRPSSAARGARSSPRSWRPGDAPGTSVIPFFAFPPAVRRVIYTTNAIESVNAQLRKIIKTRGHFPSDDAATKLIWLALRNITADWGRAAHDWKEAMNQFAILYEDRFTQAASEIGLKHEYMASTGAPPAAWQGPEDIEKIRRERNPVNRLTHKKWGGGMQRSYKRGVCRPAAPSHQPFPKGRGGASQTPSRAARTGINCTAQQETSHEHRHHRARRNPSIPRAFTSFAEFYPFYLERAQQPHLPAPALRGLDAVARVPGAARRHAATRWWLLAGLLCGYGFAWIGHFGFEKNKPASFKRPLYSFMGDWVMYKDIWTGRVKIRL